MASEQDKFQQQAVPGAFLRRASKFVATISDEAGAEFPAEAGRYRLFVAHACPWAHRCTVVRALKGLEDVITLTWTTHVLEGLGSPPPYDGYKGWLMNPPYNDCSCTGELYEQAQPGYRKSFDERPTFSVPILYDEKTGKIVNNESAQIVMMFNSAFDHLAQVPRLDLYPHALHQQIDEVNGWIYPHINDGVYRCGFAKTQESYDMALENHWEAMDKTEEFLEGKTYLVGDAPTLADLRLFPTLLRYDAVYFSHFKTCRNHLTEMPNLLRHTRMILQLPGVLDTVDMDSIVQHYYFCQTMVNPTQIVPRGPEKPRGFEDLLTMREFSTKKQKESKM